jgi:hypothetical protein
VRKPPEEAAKYIENRRGYANYYFNRLNQDRVWKALAAGGDFGDLTGPWLLQGRLGAGGDAEFLLDNNNATAQLPSGAAAIDAAKDLADQLAPEGSGGLLAALHVWRRLLTMGPQRYGEVHYQGTVPLPGRDGVFDVLVGTHNVVESHFLFDPKSGRLVALEMYSDADADPCEIYFDDYRETSGRQLPHRLQVRYGDGVFAEVQVNQFRFSAKEP